MGNLTYKIVETITGTPVAAIDPVPGSISKAVGETASNTTMLPIDASPFTAAELDQLTEEWSRTLVVSRNGKAIYSGILQDYDWDDESGMLTLIHEDSRCIFGSRTTFGTNGYSGNLPISNNLILSNIALAAVPAWLVWACIDGPSPNYDLPIFIDQGKVTWGLLNSLSTPGPFTFEYWDHEVHFVDAAFDRLKALGLEIDFEGRWNVAGNHELLLRTGKLAGGVYEFNLTAPKVPLSKLRVRRNAQRQANVVYSIGKGAEREMRVTTSRATSTGPALELSEAYKEIEDFASLQAHSDQNLATLKNPVRQWEFDIPLDFGPGIENIRFGSTFRVYSRGHKVIPDGWNDMRYLGFDIDPVAGFARVTVQPGGG